jgi:adenylate kinase family enzyme
MVHQLGWNNMRRKIIVTGTSCTGKTTLGSKLAKQFSITQIDLDDVHFLPNWVEKEDSQFIKEVNATVDGLDEWIVTGSYQTVLKDTLWEKASLIVWLDYPLNLILRRCFIRTFRRIFYKEMCCGENYETLSRMLFKENLFVWIFKTYWKRKRRLKSWRTGIFSHKEWIVLSSPNDESKLVNLV